MSLLEDLLVQLDRPAQVAGTQAPLNRRSDGGATSDDVEFEKIRYVIPSLGSSWRKASHVACVALGCHAVSSWDK